MHEEALGEITEYHDSLFHEGIKWYGYVEEMIAYSKKYPEVVFTLTGIGEEPDDMWRDYYKNGKLHGGRANIVYPTYDESQLREPVKQENER